MVAQGGEALGVPSLKVFLCSHRSCLPNPPQSHRLLSLQSAQLSSTSLPAWALLPSLSPLSPPCWFTHQFGLLIVHPRAQLLQPKAPPQIATDPSCPSTGFLWVLDLNSRQGRQGKVGTILSRARSNTPVANVQQGPPVSGYSLRYPHLLQEDRGCVATPSPTRGARTSSCLTGPSPTTRFPVPAMAEGHVCAPAALGGHPWEAVGDDERPAGPGHLPRGGTDTTRRPAWLQRRRGAAWEGECPNAARGAGDGQAGWWPAPLWPDRRVTAEPDSVRPRSPSPRPLGCPGEMVLGGWTPVGRAGMEWWDKQRHSRMQQAAAPSPSSTEHLYHHPAPRSSPSPVVSGHPRDSPGLGPASRHLPSPSPPRQPLPKKKILCYPPSSPAGKGSRLGRRGRLAPCARLSGDHSLPDAAHQHPSLIATQCLMTVIRKSEAAWGLEALTELGEPDGVRT